MEENNNSDKAGCNNCKNFTALQLSFSMAFQPIINVKQQQIFGYEALVRGINNEPASEILDRLVDDNRYSFDQAIRVKAIQLASQLGLDCMLSINFLPNAVYNAQTCIRTTLETAAELNFPTDAVWSLISDCVANTQNH